MSLLLSGVQRIKALVLMLALAVLVPAPMVFGASPASAAVEGVTVTPGEPQCYALFRTVTNSSSQRIVASVYEIRNGLRIDYPLRMELAPGESFTFNTDAHYYSHQLGIKTGGYVYSPGLPPSYEWDDWGAADYVMPPSCPQLIGAAKLTKKTKLSFKTSQPMIWFKTKAYITQLGYSVRNKRIKWSSEPYGDGLNVARGPFMKKGQRLAVKFYSRNRDDSESTTEPVFLGKKVFKRLR